MSAACTLFVGGLYATEAGGGDGDRVCECEEAVRLRQPAAQLHGAVRHRAARRQDAGCARGAPQYSLSSERWLDGARHAQASLKGFKDGTFKVLVATDVAGRGIDIPDVAHVLNFAMPSDISQYTHRIGNVPPV
eukprot:1167400-Prorocentrum_minimum.AAC.2